MAKILVGEILVDSIHQADGADLGGRDGECHLASHVRSIFHRLWPFSVSKLHASELLVLAKVSLGKSVLFHQGEVLEDRQGDLR